MTPRRTTRRTEPDPAEVFEQTIEKLKTLSEQATSEEDMRLVTAKIAQVSRRYRMQNGIGLAVGPAEQAQELDPSYVIRPHIQYLSDRLAKAVRDVERGKSRKLVVSMPPRSGKSLLISQYTPLWLLRRHPEWKHALTSYDGNLSADWSKQVRTLIEGNPDLGIELAEKSLGWSKWDTAEGGGIFTSSIGGGFTGRGARVLVIDDPVKDFVEAHSAKSRQRVWDWWVSVAQTRLEPPSLVLVVMTRWHEDDLVGRLLSEEHAGDPREWEEIVLPAIAEREDDAIGREIGDPLLSPIVDETRSEALDRWDDVRRSVGSYTFSGMYQQRPAPAQGAIFDSSWWKFWTRDPGKADPVDNDSGDPRVVYLDPEELERGQWLDSWDTSFKSQESSGDYVVGQRWVRVGGNRYLIAQQRGRWSFVKTIEKLRQWQKTTSPELSPYGHLVHKRLIEEKANGAAIIDTLKDEIAGIKPINPTTSKEARARAITPEIESGNVYLPHPTDPGNEWVQDLLSELRNFPHDVHDDQVDTLTQALSELRSPGRGMITVPGGTRGGAAPSRRINHSVTGQRTGGGLGRRRW